MHVCTGLAPSLDGLGPLCSHAEDRGTYHVRRTEYRYVVICMVLSMHLTETPRQTYIETEASAMALASQPSAIFSAVFYQQ